MRSSDDIKLPEILAPAGSPEALRCAVFNGADAVYLGMRRFSARAKAGNFSRDELKQAVEFSHFFGVKVYVTFNTVYKETEYPYVLEDMQFCASIGVDALILQDFTMISRIRSIMPDIVLHLSTQAGVHNADGAATAKRLGFDRVILSREAMLEDIYKIRDTVDIELEMFVQGALCVSFSGNCYFSSLVSGYSGNRGKCMQLCRKPYTYHSKTAYWLSPKDICLADHVKQLIDAGVCSFKIEGRMRRPEYAGEAVKCYKSAVLGERYDLSRMKRIYNRGDYTDLYLLNAKSNVIYSAFPGHIGDKIGKVRAVAGDKAVLPTALHKGDGVKFVRDNIETGSALLSQSSDKTTFSGKVRPGDQVRLTTDCELNREIISVKRYVNFRLIAVIDNCSAHFKAVSGGTSAELNVNNLLPAKTQPLNENEIISCFNKTEDFLMKMSDCQVRIDCDVFMPKSQLNAIRRALCEKLRESILKDYRISKNKSTAHNVLSEISYFMSPENCVVFRTDNVDIANRCSNLYDYVAFFPRTWNDATIDQLKLLKKPFLLEIPTIIRGDDRKLVEKTVNEAFVENVIVNNLGAIRLCKDKNILLGPMLNIINTIKDASVILSVEGRNTDKQNFVYYYGNFPIMTFCHCPKRTFYAQCGNCEGCYNDYIHDQHNNRFKLYSYKIAHCYCRLLNCIPVNLTGIDVKTDKKFVDLVGYDAEMCYNILEKINKGEKLPGGTLAFYNKNLE